MKKLDLKDDQDEEELFMRTPVRLVELASEDSNRREHLDSVVANFLVILLHYGSFSLDPVEHGHVDVNCVESI